MTTVQVNDADLLRTGDHFYRASFFVAGDWLQEAAALETIFAIAKPLQYSTNEYTLDHWEPDYNAQKVWIYFRSSSNIGAVLPVGMVSTVEPQKISTPAGVRISPVNHPESVAQGVVVIAVTIGVILGAAFVYLSLDKIEEITSDVSTSPTLSLAVIAVIVIAGVIVWKIVLK